MNKNFDPHTEEGYRNIVEMLAQVRESAKSGLWQMYSTFFNVDIESMLDSLYTQATEIYNQGKQKIEEKVVEAKSKLKETVDGQIDKLVDEYIDTVVVPKSGENVSYKAMKDAHEALANFAKWVLTK